MYGNCGKKSVFGASIPCASNIQAPQPLRKSKELLSRICGADFDTENGVCCSEEQLVALESNLKKADPLISSCPACRRNFYDFFCKFTCSSNQATFVDIVATSEAIDTKKEIVSQVAVYTDPTYAAGFFDSCKNVKFSATNGFAMDLIGGGAKTFRQFLKFLGDEKPLLGGSPFQIDFEFEPKLDLVLHSGEPKLCADAKYKCACSDCPSSCPTLPSFRDFTEKCRFGWMPCFSMGVLLVWMALICLIGAYHVRLARRRRLRLDTLDRLEDLDDEAGPEDTNTGHTETFLEAVLGAFQKLALFCAQKPKLVIFVLFVASLALSSGIRYTELATDPVQLWVSPNEPALHNRNHFELNFGEWFRVEQLIVSRTDGQPVMSWDTLQWWFERESELQSLSNGTVALSLDEFCFKPLGETCAIESFAQYFGGDIAYVNPVTWDRDLAACAESPVNCLPSFQQPLKKNLLFSSDEILESRAFVVTLLLNSKLGDTEYTERVVEYEHALQTWIRKSQAEKPELKIDYSTEVSLQEELNQSANTDAKIVVFSYVAMFLYISFALGGKIAKTPKLVNFVKTRLQLGLGGVLIILLSVTASTGLFGYLGVESTLIIAEVIPFLVLAIGVDNLFLISHELDLVSLAAPLASLDERLGLALRRVGPLCLAGALIQVLMFLLSSMVQMPAVRNFALYSAGAVAMNFVLQMTAFVSLLAIDQKRVEEGRVDFAPWIVASGDENHWNYDFTNFFKEKYGPWLLTPSRRGKILGFFMVWFGLSLALLPKIELGLDQRLALPRGSYLTEYFNSVYTHLNVGPPVFFVVKDANVTERGTQQQLCGKFGACNEFSVANILEQEFQRSNVSTLAEPASSWLDDFLTWLNPALDQCCRFRRSSSEFCDAYAPERQCVPCYENRLYNTLMESLPEGREFMRFFKRWITEPSDPCPLGGKAPYLLSISHNDTDIISSYFRASHQSLHSQADFIVAYENSLRIVDEIKSYSGLDVYAFSPFYTFFVQYVTIIGTTLKTLTAAAAIGWAVSCVLLGLPRTAAILVLCVVSILVSMGGVMAVWGISLNAVSLVNLIICFGLGVEFTVHIAKAYLGKRDEKLDTTLMDVPAGGFQAKDRRTLYVYQALCRVGGSVFGGITVTKFIGIVVLAFTRLKIFEVYYFRMWFALVAIAAAHAFVLLPTMLSMFGA